MEVNYQQISCITLIRVHLTMHLVHPNYKYHLCVCMNLVHPSNNVMYIVTTMSVCVCVCVCVQNRLTGLWHTTQELVWVQAMALFDGATWLISCVYTCGEFA